uniref:Pentatricopeptide repeat-containing protein n=1 Tax=Nelumbo nucifera TaxID=4432 RepID=A0A822YUN7_NELNU|nr:TPA_asm: hypothetical protein HUJ06_008445 [Nelumbo nucifera]
MKIFIEMLDSGLRLDVATVASILPAIFDLKDFGNCREILGYSYRNGLEPDKRVKNALISVYTKLNLIQNAFQIFGNMKNRDVISWSSMTVGFVQNDLFNEALDTFRNMIRDQAQPNPISITSILSACAGAQIIESGCVNLGYYVLLSNILADYGRWEVEAMRKLMTERRVRKVAGCSWIEVNKSVHSFVVRERAHPEWGSIFDMLRRLNE